MLSKYAREIAALGAIPSKPWKAPGTSCTSHETPAAFNRAA